MNATSLFFWILSACLSQAPPEDLSRELTRVPPLEPPAALASFRLQPGFRLLQAAAEPGIVDPVAATFDEDGRLFVVEMRGYPFPEARPIGRVRLLEDRDGDGQYEMSRIFLDDLSWPTAILAARGGIFVIAGRDLIFAADQDGDGRADLRQVQFTGFGLQNVQTLANGLIWSPDGWILAASGGSGGRITSPARPDLPPVDLGTRDFRFRPDGSAFEAIPGGGQFGHTIDDWGHRFVCSNSNHIRQVVYPPGVLDRNPALGSITVLAEIAREGGAAPVFRISPPEPWRLVRTRQRAADPDLARRLPPSELVPTGFFTSASGITLYRGSALGPDLRDNAFVGDVGGNLVHRKRLDVAGVLRHARRADEGVEFLASTDNWFRPVHFANTPSGTLLILDMYRETIEHPASIPDEIKRHLDLESGRDRGRLYELLPAGTFQRRPAPRLSQATPQELVPLLADRDAWWRETAQRLLVERADRAVIPLLAEMVQKRPTPQARYLALATLDLFQALGNSLLAASAQDPEPGIREQVARLAALHLPALLRNLAEDPAPAVVFQAALAAGGLPPQDATALLARTARRFPQDPWIRQAILISAHACAPELLLTLTREEGFARMPETQPLLRGLARQVGAKRDSAPIAGLVSLWINLPASNPSMSWLNALTEGWLERGGSIPELRSGPAGSAWDRALNAAWAQIESPRQDAAAAPEGQLQEAIQLAGRLAGTDARERLLARLTPADSAAVQRAVISALATRDENPPFPDLVLSRWADLSPSARQFALDRFLTRPQWAVALLDAVSQERLSPEELTPNQQQALREHRDPAVSKRAAECLPAVNLARQSVIDAFAQALQIAGRPDSGQAVWRKHCATCHKIGSEGHEVGPALETVAHRAPADLLLQILDPNREVAPVYAQVTIALRDGRVHSGLLASESAGSISLKQADGVIETIPRDQIESLTLSGRSLMPEGLELQLDHQAMADLIAYLKSLARAR